VTFLGATSAFIRRAIASGASNREPSPPPAG
jgi:hypothetical protein